MASIRWYASGHRNGEPVNGDTIGTRTTRAPHRSQTSAASRMARASPSSYTFGTWQRPPEMGNAECLEERSISDWRKNSLRRVGGPVTPTEISSTWLILRPVKGLVFVSMPSLSSGLLKRSSSLWMVSAGTSITTVAQLIDLACSVTVVSSVWETRCTWTQNAKAVRTLSAP